MCNVGKVEIQTVARLPTRLLILTLSVLSELRTACFKHMSTFEYVGVVMHVGNHPEPLHDTSDI